MQKFLSGGGRVFACGSCTKPRGITQDHLIEGAQIVGAATIVEVNVNGAQMLSVCKEKGLDSPGILNSKRRLNGSAFQTKGGELMILVRDVFQAKYGKGGELVALFKEARQQWPTQYGNRILTDASGSFYTVVTETTVESLAEWERRIAEVFSLPEFGAWFARMTPLVESGRREFYTIET